MFGIIGPCCWACCCAMEGDCGMGPGGGLFGMTGGPVDDGLLDDKSTVCFSCSYCCCNFLS